MGERDAAADAGMLPASLAEMVTALPYDDSVLLVVSPGHRLTMGEVRTGVRGLSRVLLDAGVTPGMAVGVIVDEGGRALVAMLAVWEAGAVCVPVNARAAVGEVVTLATETNVALLIDSRAVLPAELEGLGLVTFDDTLVGRTVRVAADVGQRYDADVALAMRTSGTTGRPKAVLLRHSGTIGTLDASLRKFGRRGDRPVDPSRALRMSLVPTSLALWAGIHNTLFSLRAGFGVIIMDKFDVTRFLAALREFSLTSTVLAPAMITMVLDDETIEDLAPLRFVRSITAPLSPALARAFYARFGIPVLNSYGQTELGGEVVGWTPSDVTDFGARKLGAVGRPYDDVSVEIRSPEGALLGVDEQGEIFVRSPFRMQGYATEAEEDGESRFVDGYLRTGDIGRLDADGFLWIDGRVSDMINRGGLKVFPGEVEEVLRRHPDVRDAVVAGVPDRRLGEVPRAWIIAERPMVDADLVSWCRDHLAPYKIPVAFTRVDDFPRNDIGKILRRELVAMPTS